MIDHDVWPVHDELVRAGVIAPAAPSGPEALAWIDCDLASLAESWLGDRRGPQGLDAAQRDAWRARTLADYDTSLERRSEQERCYWLLHGGARAGTVSLAASAPGERLYLASLYVLPSHRGLGVGRRALASVMDALRRQGLGLLLDTSWCWQRTVRFYLELGLWLETWKRDLTFAWDPATPPHRLAIDGDAASLSVEIEGAKVLLARARRRGDALDFDLDAPTTARLADARLGEARRQAGSTLALLLALHGWPLVRSAEDWERCAHADAGPPEALAYKLTLWEAWAHQRGWVVETPRIPGIEYPTWDEHEARWKEGNRAPAKT